LKNARIGTAVCAEDSDVLIIQESDYENVKREFDKKMQFLIINILKSSFPTMSMDLIYTVYKETKCVNLKKNEKIENEKYDFFCLVKKGSITVHF